MPLKFCADCQSMMIPKEDRQEKKLYYICTNNPHHAKRAAENNMIHSQSLEKDKGVNVDYFVKQIGKEVIYGKFFFFLKNICLFIHYI